MTGKVLITARPKSWRLHVPAVSLRRRVLFYDAGTPLIDLMDAGLVVNVGEKLDALGVADQIDSGTADFLTRLTNTDSLYDLPLGQNIEGFWYNKALFEQAGIENPPTTWDEMLEDAQGSFRGYTISEMPSDISGYTQLVSDELNKVTGTSAWFEAAMDSELSQIAQENVQSLMNGDMTPEDYTQSLQDIWDAAH